MESNVFELKGLYNEAINYIESKKEKNLAFVPAICGADYENCNSKIMIVGRAPNGWSFMRILIVCQRIGLMPVCLGYIRTDRKNAMAKSIKLR